MADSLGTKMDALFLKSFSGGTKLFTENSTYYEVAPLGNQCYSLCTV